MSSLKELKLPISEREFYRDFRTNIRDPLVARLMGKKDKAAPKLMELLEEELPKFLYLVITKMEQKSKSGLSKLNSVIVLLKEFLDSHELGWLTPWLIPIVQRSVRLIYQKYFEAFLDSKGLEDALEWLIGFELSSDSEEPKPLIPVEPEFSET